MQSMIHQASSEPTSWLPLDEQDKEVARYNRAYLELPAAWWGLKQGAVAVDMLPVETNAVRALSIYRVGQVESRLSRIWLMNLST